MYVIRYDNIGDKPRYHVIGSTLSKNINDAKKFDTEEELKKYACKKAGAATYVIDFISDFGSIENTKHYENIKNAANYFKNYAKEVKNNPEQYQCEDADQLHSTANLLQLIYSSLDNMWK